MSKSGRVYNKAMLQFLTDNYPLMFIDDLTEAFNKQFGKKKTQKQIKACLSNHGIKAGVRRTRTPSIYTPEQLIFIKEGYKELTLRRLTTALNEKFKTNFTESQIRACTRNHNFKSGRTGHFEKGHESWNKDKKGLQLGGESGWFKPGLQPVNYREIGSERINIYGYIEVKIADPNVWDLKHRVVWRNHFGEIGSKDLICFKDNNKTNVDIDNLMLVNQAEMAVMNKRGFSKYTNELKETALSLVKLNQKVNKLQSDLEKGALA